MDPDLWNMDPDLGGQKKLRIRIWYTALKEWSQVFKQDLRNITDDKEILISLQDVLNPK
jgi:hypothetical protein